MATSPNHRGSRCGTPLRGVRESDERTARTIHTDERPFIELHIKQQRTMLSPRLVPPYIFGSLWSFDRSMCRDCRSRGSRRCRSRPRCRVTADAPFRARQPDSRPGDRSNESGGRPYDGDHLRPGRVWSERSRGQRPHTKQRPLTPYRTADCAVESTSRCAPCARTCIDFRDFGAQSER
jgi:hypothetical protein